MSVKEQLDELAEWFAEHTPSEQGPPPESLSHEDWGKVRDTLQKNARPAFGRVRVVLKAECDRRHAEEAGASKSRKRAARKAMVDADICHELAQDLEKQAEALAQRARVLWQRAPLPDQNVAAVTKTTKTAKQAAKNLQKTGTDELDVVRASQEELLAAAGQSDQSQPQSQTLPTGVACEVTKVTKDLDQALDEASDELHDAAVHLATAVETAAGRLTSETHGLADVADPEARAAVQRAVDDLHAVAKKLREEKDARPKNQHTGATAGEELKLRLMQTASSLGKVSTQVGNASRQIRSIRTSMNAAELDDTIRALEEVHSQLVASTSRFDEALERIHPPPPSSPSTSEPTPTPDALLQKALDTVEAAHERLLGVHSPDAVTRSFEAELDVLAEMTLSLRQRYADAHRVSS